LIGGDDVQNKKPHPEPLLLVAENYPGACGAAVRRRFAQ
jgi:phosphoglycolate phosphatase-like HAD superfamily hydrolase